MTNISIEQIHKEKTGKISDKWASYLPFYDELFEKYRLKKLSILEIGVGNGGSLDTWATYFSEANTIVGCDINEQCSNLQYDDSRINLVLGDINQPSTFEKVTAISDNFDVVVDDGSHISNDILTSFYKYFSLVKPGGLYMIEDTHSLYMTEYGGGILNELSAYNFFKKIIDVINIQFWGAELSIDVYLRSFFPLGGVPSFINEGWIEAVEFRNSIIVIRKSLVATREKLGKRLVTGRIAYVNEELLKIQNV